MDPDPSHISATLIGARHARAAGPRPRRTRGYDGESRDSGRPSRWLPMD